MSEVKVLKFRFLPLTRELLFQLSKKHECSKSEMVRRMIHEKAGLELSIKELTKVGGLHDGL